MIPNSFAVLQTWQIPPGAYFHQMPAAERKTFSKATIQRINSRMDVVSRQWAGTAIGQTLELVW